ncbi:Ras family protein [Pelomyxa schiedti]|nr:Ras family protein [Pelomyxa schiedti]
MARPFDFLFRVLLHGDRGVGKTWLLERFVGTLWPAAYIEAAGIDFRLRTIECDGKYIRLQIWDTVKADGTVSRPHYKDIHGVAIVFDSTNMETFSNVKHVLDEIEKSACEDICKVLVASKIDLVSKRVVESSVAKEFADRMGMPFIETSAKCDVNVDELFILLAHSIKDRLSVNWKELIVQLKLALLCGIHGRTGKRSPISCIPQPLMKELISAIPWEKLVHDSRVGQWALLQSNKGGPGTRTRSQPQISGRPTCSLA